MGTCGISSSGAAATRADSDGGTARRSVQHPAAVADTCASTSSDAHLRSHSIASVPLHPFATSCCFADAILTRTAAPIRKLRSRVRHAYRWAGPGGHRDGLRDAGRRPTGPKRPDHNALSSAPAEHENPEQRLPAARASIRRRATSCKVRKPHRPPRGWVGALDSNASRTSAAIAQRRRRFGAPHQRKGVQHYRTMACPINLRWNASERSRGPSRL